MQAQNIARARCTVPAIDPSSINGKLFPISPAAVPMSSSRRKKKAANTAQMSAAQK
jgi:hypothetical protein